MFLKAVESLPNYFEQKNCRDLRSLLDRHDRYVHRRLFSSLRELAAAYTLASRVGVPVMNPSCAQVSTVAA